MTIFSRPIHIPPFVAIHTVKPFCCVIYLSHINVVVVGSRNSVRTGNKDKYYLSVYEYLAILGAAALTSRSSPLHFTSSFSSALPILSEVHVPYAIVETGAQKFDAKCSTQRLASSLGPMGRSTTMASLRRPVRRLAPRKDFYT